LYLIDGQQRITTLFLLLLAIYRNLPDGEKQFNEKYFKNSSPKLDYRVRENAHNFLIDFIRFVFDTKHSSADFKELSPKYYDIYSTDPTISSVLSNYELIQNWVQVYAGAIDDFRSYVEDFVEFNYFDTGISEQGEKLYLYMNSRGEGLSAQENVRPRIISRCKPGQKLQAGACWENWQNYFWRHREKNVNADDGFFGFIKVAMILHQQEHQNTCVLKKCSGNFSNKDMSLSRTAHREEYISNKFVQNHKQWVSQYVVENEDFSFSWLDEVFRAFERVYNLNDKSEYKFIRETSFASKASMNTINYAPLCATVLLCCLAPSVTDENLHRFGMYVLGHCDKSNNSKVPDTATIRAMEMAKYLSKVPSQDVRFLTKEIPEVNEYFYRSSDKFFSCVNPQNEDAKEWEKLFFEIISDQSFNTFLDADYNSLITLSVKDDEPSLSLAKHYLKKLRELYRHHQDKTYVSSIMQYGDISEDYGSGWLEGYMEKYTLPLTKEYWQSVLNSSLNIVRNFFDGNKPESLDNYIKALTSDSVLGYMENGKFLWHEGLVYPNIIVLKKSNASERLAKSLPILLLHESLANSWLWSDDHRYCVIDFCIENHCFVPKESGLGKYCIDIIYKWGVECVTWECWLKQRSHQPIAQLEKEYNEQEAGYLIGKFQDETGYNSLGSMNVISEIVKFVEQKKKGLQELLS
jgi:hypothetical protein